MVTDQGCTNCPRGANPRNERCSIVGGARRPVSATSSSSQAELVPARFGHTPALALTQGLSSVLQSPTSATRFKASFLACLLCVTNSALGVGCDSSHGSVPSCQSSKAESLHQLSAEAHAAADVCQQPYAQPPAVFCAGKLRRRVRMV